MTDNANDTTITTSGYMYVVPNPCEWCNGRHLDNKCPYVKQITYFRNGSIKSVEFFAPSTWPYPIYTPYFTYPYYPYSPYLTWTYGENNFSLTITNNDEPDGQTTYVYNVNG